MGYRQGEEGTELGGLYRGKGLRGEGKERKEGDSLAPNRIPGSVTVYLTGKMLYNIEHYSYISLGY
jgi:hypothetical protein